MRWIGLKQLSDETGMAVRTLQYIAAREPGVLVTRQEDARPVEYKQPDCAINLRNREVEKAGRKGPGEPNDARKREDAARADMAEMDLAERRGELVTVADFHAELRRILEPVRAGLGALPGRLAPQLVEVPSAPIAQRKLQAGIAEVLQDLQAKADEAMELEREEGVA